MKLEKVDPKQTDSIAELVRISKEAFDTDISVGAQEPGGPPDYDSVEWHVQMAKEGHLFKATVEENIVGGALLFFDEQKQWLYVGRIFIDSRYHRQGYGAELTELVESVYPDAKAVFLDTPLWNVRTNAFYQRLDYQKYKQDDEFAYYQKTLK